MEGIHKKVQVVIIDISRIPFSLLLLKTNKKRGEFWQSVTGSVENEETYHQGALRELQEETGIETDGLVDLDFNFEFMDRFQKQVKEQVYLCLLKKTPGEIKISPEEHTDYKWVKVNELSKEDFKFESNYHAFIKAINHCKKYEEESL
jgi:dATP pyrophosphohydrolase